MSENSDGEIREILDDIRGQLDDETELEPTNPGDAFGLWIDQQRSEKSDATIDSYERRVSPFLSYIGSEFGIQNLNELTTRHVKAYEAKRKAQGLQANTLNNQFGTIRLFLEYCEALQAVNSEITKALTVPGLSKHERVNTEKLPPQRATEILENLERYRYASREHAVFLLLWHTTARIGTIRALDLEDVYLTGDDLERIRIQLEDEGYLEDIIEDLMEDASLPFIYPRHRPGSETPLKNNDGGERLINLTGTVGDVLRDYVRVNRNEIDDEYGRTPLFTSKKGTGRLSTSAIRNWCYILTQPCEFGGDCPYDEDPETCDAREHGHGSKCPGSKSPHKIRTGSITYHTDKGWPRPDLADRANTSEELIDGVYDQPEQLTRGTIRRRHLEKIEDDQQ